MFTDTYKIILGLFCALGIFNADAANLKRYLINTDHSNIQFKISYLKISEVFGSFRDFEGEFLFDAQSSKIKGVNLYIKSNSIDTDNEKRDAHLRKKEFLYVSEFPNIVFESKKVITVSANEYVVNGELKFLNNNIATKIELKFLGAINDSWGKENLFFGFKLVLNRKDLGIVWNKALDQGGHLLGDKIFVDGKIQAQPQGERTVFSRFMVPDKASLRLREKVKKPEQASRIESQEDHQSINEKSQNVTLNIDDPNEMDSEPSTIKVKSHEFSLLQILSYLFIGLYGFIGAISLALICRIQLGKKSIAGKGMKLIFIESLFDAFTILLIVPYALAMWSLYYF